MNNFNRGGDRGGNRGGGFKKPWEKDGGRGGDRGDRREVTMHKTVCSECGNSCEVPFKPSSDKPVYCDNCFSNKRDNRNDDRGDRGNFKNQTRAEGRLRKPDYVSTPRHENNDNSDIKKQLSDISNKLDNLVKVLEMSFTEKVSTKETKTTSPKKEVTKKVTAKKEVKKEKVSPKKKK